MVEILMVRDTSILVAMSSHQPPAANIIKPSVVYIFRQHFKWQGNEVASESAFLSRGRDVHVLNVSSLVPRPL